MRTTIRKVVKAMQQCLDGVNAGDIALGGQTAQQVCLGWLSEYSGVVAPSHVPTGRKIASAETAPRNAIQNRCPGGTLASLQTCGTSTTTTGNCLVCTSWRRTVEAVRSAYGPN
jgi:hypothetical protein